MVRSIADIQDAISHLSPADRRQLFEWLDEQEDRAWDEQIGRDFDQGKLSDLMQRARDEARQGTLRPGP